MRILEWLRTPAVATPHSYHRFGTRGERPQRCSSDAFGSHGWMLWNQGNVYSAEAFKKEIRTASVEVAANPP